MKKRIALLLLAALCLSLCGCDAVQRPLPTPSRTPAPTAAAAPEPVPEATNAPEETAAPAEAAADASPVIVSISRTELEAMDPQTNQTRILTFSYDTPTVSIEGRPEAAAAISDWLSLLTEAYYTGESYGEGYGTGYNNMLTMAEDNYNLAVESGNNYFAVELTADRRAHILRNDGHVLSLLFNDYSYLGGAHGGVMTRAFCFDPETGKLLTLDDLSPDRAGLTAALSQAMSRIARSDAEISERIDLVQAEELDAALAALVREGSWYLDYGGIVLFSDDYEISSHAAGPISFLIPYSDISAYLHPRFIPAASPDGGVLSVAREQDMAGQNMEIIDKVRAGEEWTTVYFIADGTLRDVTLASVDYSGVFYETAQLWSCSELKDCAVQVSTMIPDGMPSLRISYRTADGVKNLYLTESGEDGHLILLDGESIEAVG